jgi:hypothetical protein
MRALWGLFRLVIGFALVLVIALGIKALIGKKDGEPCSNSLDCARVWGAQCLQTPHGQRYCTFHCIAQKECPEGWTCSRVLGLGTFSQGEESVCARPESGSNPSSSSPASNTRPHR